jgi:hypothetical protein
MNLSLKTQRIKSTGKPNNTMKFLSGISAAALVAVAVSGCSHKPDDKFVPKPPETVPAAAVTPGNEASLFPLDKGNQWTYSVELLVRSKGANQPLQNYETVWTVTDSKQTPNGIEATIDTTLPGKKSDKLKWRSNSKGIYEIADGAVEFTPAFPVVLFPVKEGNTFAWNGLGPNGTPTGGAQTSQRTVRASEVVDTDMGQMSAIPVDDHGTVEAKGKKGNTLATDWFAPGVGIVRLRQEVVVGDQGYVLLLKLKSKSLMKS